MNEIEQSDFFFSAKKFFLKILKMRKKFERQKVNFFFKSKEELTTKRESFP